MAVTINQLAVSIGLSADLNAQIADALAYRLTQVNDTARLLVYRYAPSAPQDVKDQAQTLIGGYLYDAKPSRNLYSNALTQSGAAALLDMWRGSGVFDMAEAAAIGQELSSSTKAEIYRQLRDILIEGDHIDLVPNDETSTIDISSTGGPGGGQTKSQVEAAIKAHKDIPDAHQAVGVTRSQMDAAIETHKNISEAHQSFPDISGKADTSYVNSQIKAHKDDADAHHTPPDISGKLDASAFANHASNPNAHHARVDISGKADRSEIGSAIRTHAGDASAHHAPVDISGKADTTAVDAKIKAHKDDADAHHAPPDISGKADTSYVNTEVGKVNTRLTTHINDHQSSSSGQTAQQVDAKIAAHAGLAEAHQAQYVLPAATSSKRGGVFGITNAIIDAASSNGYFAWTINHVKRVVNDVFGDGSVTTEKLADDAVTSRKLGANVVTQGHLANSAIIDSTRLENNAVTQRKIAADTIEHGHMRNDSVGTAEIIDDNVTEAKLASAVRTKLNARATGGGTTDSQARSAAATAQARANAAYTLAEGKQDELTHAQQLDLLQFDVTPKTIVGYTADDVTLDWRIIVKTYPGIPDTWFTVTLNGGSTLAAPAPTTPGADLGRHKLSAAEVYQFTLATGTRDTMVSQRTAQRQGRDIVVSITFYDAISGGNIVDARTLTVDWLAEDGIRLQRYANEAALPRTVPAGVLAWVPEA